MDRKVGKTGNEADKSAPLPSCHSHLQHSVFLLFILRPGTFFSHIVSTLHSAVSLFSLLPFLEESLTHLSQVHWLDARPSPLAAVYTQSGLWKLFVPVSRRG